MQVYMRITKRKRKKSEPFWVENTPALLQPQELSSTFQKVNGQGTGVAEAECHPFLWEGRQATFRCLQVSRHSPGLNLYKEHSCVSGPVAYAI